MEGRGGGRKPFEVWDHVTKLGGNRVKCKRCDFEFSAPSATRIKSHLYSIPRQGIRGCPNLDGAAGSSSERGKNIARSGNHEIEVMNSDPDLVVLANKTRENINKRKEIAVEVEQKQSKVQRHGKERLEDENVGEESRSPLSVLVADLEEKLDASVARERKLEKELAELKEKYEHDSTVLTNERNENSRLMNEIFVRESKLKEVEISLSTVQEQLSHAGEKLDASKEKADIADITTSEAEKAGEEISLLGAQISHVKEKTDAFWKEKANHFTNLEEAKQGSSNTTLKLVSFLEEDNHDFICLDNPFEFNSNEQGFESFQLSSKTLGEKDIINTITFWKMFYGTKR